MRTPAHRTGLMLWLSFFVFATSAALLFQKLLLPRFPTLHSGSGLLEGDAARFHAAALEAAQAIGLHGWSHWSLYPAAELSANIGIMAALYALFGADPAVMVPINAALHATGGVLIYAIAREVAPGATGRVAGIMAGTLFVVFPSSLNWYGQVHKDGYVIVGLLVTIWSWLWLRNRPAGGAALCVVLGSTLAGMVLAALARSYLLPLMLVAMTAGLATMVALDRAALWREKPKLGIYALSLALLAGSQLAWKPHVTQRYPLLDTPPVAAADSAWERSAWLPAGVDRLFESAVRVRRQFTNYAANVRTGSIIDADVRLDSAGAVVAYLPRALQIGLFAPFPARWLESSTAQHWVSVVEMIVWYLIAPGVVFAAWRLRPAPIALVTCFATIFIAAYAIAMPNVGTLYRMRYGFLFLFVLVGAIGWADVLRRLGSQTPARTAHGRSGAGGARSDHAGEPATGPFEADVTGTAALPVPGKATADGRGTGRSRRALLGAGAMVAVFTGVTYVGLFVRDVVLARWFGVGPELDAFFLAAAVPTFLVVVVSLPLGAMIVPAFLALKERASESAAQAFVSRISALYTAGMCLIAVLLLAGATPLLHGIGRNLTPDGLGLARLLLWWMLPIVMLSGFVVLANALLNALGRFAAPSAAQLAVPVASILALLVLGDSLGIAAAAAGMLLGQLFNLWLVSTALAKEGYSVRPAWRETAIPLRESMGQYLALAAGALLTSAAAPVNLGIASTLTPGSAAALGLGTKVATFLTGLVGAVVTTAVLPYFVAFTARNRLAAARDELSFLLVAATVLTVPASAVLLLVAEPIVRLAFEGGAFGDADVRAVTRVAGYSIVQLPFFTANMLLLRFAIATHHSGRVLTSSLLALCINTILALALIDVAGVAGIALAATVAVAFSTSVMLLLFCRLGHISWTVLAVLALTWLSFASLVACHYAPSTAGMWVATMALLPLLCATALLVVPRGMAGRAPAARA